MNWEFLDTSLPGGTLQAWLVALALSTLLTLAVMLLKPALARRLGGIAGRTRTRLDDALLKAIEATRAWLVAVVSLSLGTQYLELTERAGAVVAGVASVAGFVQLGLWLRALLREWLAHSRSRALGASATSAATSIGAVGLLIELALWSLVVLLALDNMGVNITALVAGLGIGGIAVALAAQNILGDLFASLSIVVDKPFVVGDFIVVDSYMGTVENIGLKTTRLRSVDGEQIILGNADLLKARLRNYKRMYERRVVFGFRLGLNTPADKAEKVPGLVRSIVEGQRKIRFERAHFVRFGDSTLDFEAVYWVLDPDQSLHMDIQQSINLGLMRALAKERLALAYPVTQMAFDPGTPPPERSKGWHKPREEMRRATAEA